jgi:hypothetical protein
MIVHGPYSSDAFPVNTTVADAGVALSKAGASRAIFRFQTRLRPGAQEVVAAPGGSISKSFPGVAKSSCAGWRRGWACRMPRAPWQAKAHTGQGRGRGWAQAPVVGDTTTMRRR